MDSDYLTNPLFVLSVLVGASVWILLYFVNSFRNAGEHVQAQDKSKIDKSGAQLHLDKKNKEQSLGGKRKKKAAESKVTCWAGKHDKHNYSHPWLLVSLKGHTGNILDMDFSSNGKYLTSCDDEDPDPGGDTAQRNTCDLDKENIPIEVSPSPKGLTRRQRKNRRREDSSEPKPKKSPELTKKQIMSSVPSKQYRKLNVSEKAFVGFLRNYLLTLDQMMAMGYPIQSSLEPTLVVVYKSPRVPIIPVHKTVFDVNAREFVPKNDWSSNDSGHGSGNSSEGEDSTDQDCSERPVTSLPKGVQGSYFARTCSRCTSTFYTTSDKYITKDKCYYHWGRLKKNEMVYDCCLGKVNTKGCTEAKLHVWCGLHVGMNGLYDDFTLTKQRKNPPPDGNYGVYSLDCEMCYTVRGLVLTKVTVVGMDGRLVYDSFVKPDDEIVDYNTKFSGITARDFKRNPTKSLKEVQNDLMGFINADTILIGHGLENDLRALKIVHYINVDTAHSFPHFHGLPYRRSLRSLTSAYLNRNIQCSRYGHNSYEDAVGAVFIWDTKDLTQKDRKSVRVNIKFDHATHVKFSPDSKAFIINKYSDNTVEVYKVEKKKDGWLTASQAFTFPKQHETDIISIDIQRNGKFIITCSNRTDLVIWDLKGQKLAQIDTYLMNNTCAKISPCGKFIAATGFSPEAKIWEVLFDNSGEFKDVKSIKELTLGGHSSGVYDVAFDVDSSHMATVSKDGTWRLYDTKVSYKLGQNARFLKSGNYERSGNNALIALSPDAEVLAIATGADVALYSTRNNRLDYVLENIYFDKVTSMMFDSTGRYLLTSGDKQIRVFHNVTGYRSNVANAEEKLKENITSATRERLRTLIKEYRDFLKGIENL
ncbi:unnamed protein product [Phyllotreta striolata]|uniref:Exonuclease domain-containing protein n=1 Tax=Phyllotreta striolata TaxID=444603 RepID=A0A9N9TET4_PHYSR|nr:unnamed protein product [Phyllotreta striolata]